MIVRYQVVNPGPFLFHRHIHMLTCTARRVSVWHAVHAGYAFVCVQTEHLPGLSCLSFSEAIYTASFP
jgi:hypothetical protein